MNTAEQQNDSQEISLLNENVVEHQRMVFDKLTRHVVYLSMGIIFVFNSLRGNVGLAANDLCKDLNLTHAEYGNAISLFSVGSVSSQVASTVMLRYFGAPIWLSFIVFAWGCLSIAMGFVRTRWQLYLVKILLGIAEGGSFPGVNYYLSLFFPEAYIEEPYGSIQAAVYIAVPLSVPMAAGLLSTDGMLGTTGWRNLFFVQGLIPLMLAVVLFFKLPKSLETSAFLEPEEKNWLMTQHKEQEEIPLSHVFKEITEIIKIFPFWLITVVVGVVISYYVVLVGWTTLILHEGLHTDREVDKNSETCGSEGRSVLAVMLTAIPYTLCSLLCYCIRKQTHRIYNRTAFTALVLVICAVMLISWVFTSRVSFIFGFVSLTGAIAISGVPNMFACGITLTLLRSDLRAAGMGLANCMASMIVIGLPIIVGIVVDSYGYDYAMVVIAGMMLVAAICSAIIKDPLLDIKRSSQQRSSLATDTQQFDQG